MSRFAFAPLAATLCLLPLPGAGQPRGAPPTSVATIPADSPLVRIDPNMVACGRKAIALMDATRDSTGWQHRKFPAFKVIGNTYSVGIAAVTAYLIDTGAGLILIDTTFNETAPWVADAITGLGFKLADIKIILGTHAHLDHQGGDAWMKKHAPNAKLMVMDADVATMQAGTPPGLDGSGNSGFPPVVVDRVLHDGDKIALGGVTVTAWKTAGHTPGAASYEWTTTEAGKTYKVLMVGSQQAAEMLAPEGYPGIVTDQINAWTRLLSLAPDVWFGGHSWQHNNIDKFEAMRVDPATNPFIDPEGYRCVVAARAADFVTELRKQTAAAGARE